MPTDVSEPTGQYDSSLRRVSGTSGHIRVPVGVAVIAGIGLAVIAFSVGTRVPPDPAVTPVPTVSPAETVVSTQAALISTPRARATQGGLTAAEALAIALSQVPGNLTDIETIRLVPFRDTGLFAGVEAERWVWLVRIRTVTPGGGGSPDVEAIERFAVDQWTGEIIAGGFELSP